MLLSPPSAVAAQPTKTGGTTTVTTKAGLSLTVTPVRQLNSAGATVKVTGTGYNPLVGIYVTLCVTPRKGQKPTPCGGADFTGSDPAAKWVSSNPPPYGATLSTPYRPGGTFSVKLRVSSMIGEIDCRIVKCSIVTKTDHIRAEDRTYDVLVPVTFSP